MDKRIIASIVSLIATILVVKIPTLGDQLSVQIATICVAWVVGWLTPQPQGKTNPAPDATFPAGGGK